MKQGIVVLMLGLFLGLMVQGGRAADVQMNGNVGVSGSVTASSFVGDGSGLSGVEKRTAISACGTISTSGSYYVTENLTTTGTCITVTAQDVTIDLNGFALTGDGSANHYGLYIYNVSNVEVRNGTVRGFSFGIATWFSGSATKSIRVLNVRAIGNGIWGIQLMSANNLVRDCSAADNGSGIYANIGSVVINNTVYNNQGTGISAGHGSIVTNNAVDSNNLSDSPTYGGMWVISCSVKNNTVRGNHLNNIYVSGSGSAIEENLVTDSTGYGIYFATTGNYYGNNRARNNASGNYYNGGSQYDGGGNAEF